MAAESRKIVFWEVDAQQDFMLPGGKLYVPGAERIIPNIKRLAGAARKGRRVFFFVGGRARANDPECATFPPHCIRGTEGARIVPEGLTKDYLIIPNREKFPLPADLLDHAQIIIEKQALDVL